MGNHREYEAMFDKAFNGCTVEELINDIYINSDETVTRSDVTLALLEIYNNNIRNNKKTTTI